MTTQKVRQTPAPYPGQAPGILVRWLWKNQRHGYGVLDISVEVRSGDTSRWDTGQYFAQALKGPLGRVWRLSKLVTGTGIEDEYVVDLVGHCCECEGFKHRGKCRHLSALLDLEKRGEL